MSTVAQLQTMVAIKARQRTRLEDALRQAQAALAQAQQEGLRLEDAWEAACDAQQQSLDRLLGEMSAGQRTRADDILVLKGLLEARELATAQARRESDAQQGRIAQALEDLGTARRNWSRCSEQIEQLKERLQAAQRDAECIQEDAQDEESEEGAIARRLREAHAEH